MKSIESLLYGQTKQILKTWPGYTLKTKGIPGTCCSLNKNNDQTAQVSRIAYALEAAIDSRLSVCCVEGQNMAYVEFRSEAASAKPQAYIVFFDPSTDTFEVSSDDSYRKGILPAIAGLFLFSDNLVKEYPVLAELSTLMNDYPAVNAEQMLQICDLFYWAFSASVWSFKTVDQTSFEAQKERMIQSGMLRHISSTAKPVGINVVDGEISSAEVIQEDIFTMPLDEFFAKCKKGEFLINYPWNDMQRKAIKPLSYLNSFVPTEEFRQVFISVYRAVNEKLEAMRNNVPYDIIMETPINILIMGKPGTGKTKTIEAIMCALGFPKGFINCKETSEEDEFEGMPKVIDGRLQSVTTEIARFFSIGGCVSLEEINLPNPGITQGALGQALVNPCILKVDGFKECKRHPLTLIFATMNVGTNGSKPLNEALASRFEAIILEDTSQFDDIIFKSGYDKKFCKTAIKAYNAAVSYLIDNGSEELTRLITVRGTITMARKLSYGFTKAQALRSAFVSQIYAVDPALAADMESCVDKAI